MASTLQKTRTILLIVSMALSLFSVAMTAHVAHAEVMSGHHHSEQSCFEGCGGDAQDACLRHCIELAVKHKTDTSGILHDDNIEPNGADVEEGLVFNDNSIALAVIILEARHPNSNFLEQHHFVQKNE